MNIKQTFKNGWGFGSPFNPGSGACQRPCESSHLYKQTKKPKKKQNKRRFLSAVDNAYIAKILFYVPSMKLLSFSLKSVLQKLRYLLYSSFKHFKWYTASVAAMSPSFSFASTLWPASSIAIAFTFLCRNKVWHWCQLLSSADFPHPKKAQLFNDVSSRWPLLGNF